MKPEPENNPRPPDGRSFLERWIDAFADASHPRKIEFPYDFIHPCCPVPCDKVREPHQYTGEYYCEYNDKTAEAFAPGLGCYRDPNDCPKCIKYYQKIANDYFGEKGCRITFEKVSGSQGRPCHGCESGDGNQDESRGRPGCPVLLKRPANDRCLPCMTCDKRQKNNPSRAAIAARA